MTQRNRHHLDRGLVNALVTCNKQEIRRLLESGVDINAEDDEHRESAIMLATKFADKEVIDLLIKAGANVDARDDRGRSALFFAHAGSEIFLKLIAAGADIHAADQSGTTILMQKVSESASVAEVEELLRRGVDPHLRNGAGETALDLAVSLGLVNVIKRLRFNLHRT